MKKLIAILFVTLFSLSVVGCTPDEDRKLPDVEGGNEGNSSSGESGGSSGNDR